MAELALQDGTETVGTTGWRSSNRRVSVSVCVWLRGLCTGAATEGEPSATLTELPTQAKGINTHRAGMQISVNGAQSTPK